MTAVFRENMIDMLQPLDAEQQIIGVTTETTENLHVSGAITVLFDYSDTAPNGIVLPLELTVIPVQEIPPGAFRKTFRRYAPNSYTFRISYAGQYVVCLKEKFHNQNFGTLVIEVQGDPLIDVPLARRQRYG